MGAMANYLITDSGQFGITAEVTHVDGVVETKTGFPTKELALAWVGERLIVRPDTVSEGCSKP